uniref:Uncharacterized protein n=1 Tax=Arundo donax TaxID=35708 RepID=A0A0A9AHK8_ARUDO
MRLCYHVIRADLGCTNCAKCTSNAVTVIESFKHMIR